MANLFYSVCCFLWRAFGWFTSESRHKAHRYQMYNCTCTAGCGTSLRGNGVNSTTGCGLQMAATTTGCAYNYLRRLQPGVIKSGCAYNRVRLQLSAALTTGCHQKWVRLQPGALTTGCAFNWVRLQVVAAQPGTLTTGCHHKWVRLQRGAAPCNWARAITRCGCNWVWHIICVFQTFHSL